MFWYTFKWIVKYIIHCVKQCLIADNLTSELIQVYTQCCSAKENIRADFKVTCDYGTDNYKVGERITTCECAYDSKIIDASRRLDDIWPVYTRVFIPRKCKQLTVECKINSLNKIAVLELDDVDLGWHDYTLFLKEAK